MGENGRKMGQKGPKMAEKWGKNQLFRLILKKLLPNQKGTIRQNISGIWVTKFTGKLFDDVIAG